MASTRVVPRFDPPNILWYFGAWALAFASISVINEIPESHHDLWELLVSLAFFGVYAVAAAVLLRAWPVPSGLCAALAVAMVPAIGYGIASLARTFPKEPLFDPFQRFSWTIFLIGLATIVVGLLAFALTRFAFLFFVILVALSLTVQFALPGIDSHPSAEAHLITAIVVGIVFVAVGLMLDFVGLRRDAFWFHVTGFTNVALGLAYFSVNSTGDTNRGWIPMIIAGGIVLLCSAPLARASWAAYGLLGFYAPIVHWLTSGLRVGSQGKAWILLAVGASIFLVGFGLFGARAFTPRRRRVAPPPV